MTCNTHTGKNWKAKKKNTLKSGTYMAATSKLMHTIYSQLSPQCSAPTQLGDAFFIFYKFLQKFFFKKKKKNWTKNDNWKIENDVHEIYIIKYSNICIFGHTFKLSCDWI